MSKSIGVLVSLEILLKISKIAIIGKIKVNKLEKFLNIHLRYPFFSFKSYFLILYYNIF